MIIISTHNKTSTTNNQTLTDRIEQKGKWAEILDPSEGCSPSGSKQAEKGREQIELCVFVILKSGKTNP